MELEPALGKNYLAFSNSIDRALRDLGIERKEIAKDITPEQMAEIIKAEAVKKEESE